MKYSISDTPLKLKEYGRNIQSMVEYARTIENREKRSKLAHEIVRIMSNLYPQLKEIPDYKVKLWDHIFLISDFELDVDSPYPMPKPEEVRSKPTKRMEYYDGRPRFRQYGWNVQLMINEAIEMPEGPDKKAYVNLIANTMKTFLRSMDRETTPEEVVADHINEISKGKLQIDGRELTFSKTPLNFKQPAKNSNTSVYTKRGRKSNKYSNNSNSKNNHKKNNHKSNQKSNNRSKRKRY